MPATVSSSGTEDHNATACRNVRVVDHDPGPFGIAATAVRHHRRHSEGTPESVSHCTSSARGTGGKATSTQRLATVTSSGVTSSASSTKTVSPGGSSSVFKIAGARSAARCASRTTITWRAACSGRRCANATTWRRSPMETEAPLRRTTCRSGSVPARAARQVAHSPQPPSGHRSAAANPYAAASPPFPGGPRKR